MLTIPVSEADFHPQSFGTDLNGRLFEFEGDLYRAMTSRSAALYRQLFKEGIIQGWIDRGFLVGSEIAPFHLQGYDLVLKHARVPFVSYPFEWNALMLKDATLGFLDFSIALAKVDLTTEDANPWNMLFAGCQPLYVDFCSIIPPKPNLLWPPYNEFCRFFLYPLYLMSVGYTGMTRWTLHDPFDGIPPVEFKAAFEKIRPNFRTIKDFSLRLRRKVTGFLPDPWRASLKESWRFLKEKTYPVSRQRLDFLKRLKCEVESISFTQESTVWSEYYDGCFPEFTPARDWTAKHITAFEVLKRLQPTSVLDIGSSTGWYSRLAATCGSQVVGIDKDEACVTALYLEAKARNLSILPLIMDFRNPSPGYGLSNKWFAPATERLKCDMVMALALVHHLVFKDHFNFEQICAALDVFSKKWLLVEFIARDDQYVKEWCLEEYARYNREYAWYNIDSFCASLQKFYHRLEVMPSYPSSRKLLLCEK